MEYDQKLARYRDWVSAWPDQKVKGKANPYTSLNGNMFTFLDKTGLLAIRLSSADKTAYETQFGTGDVIQHNAVMRGYVPLIDALWSDEEARQIWWEKCWDNAQSLPPKPTKKSK